MVRLKARLLPILLSRIKLTRLLPLMFLRSKLPTMTASLATTTTRIDRVAEDFSITITISRIVLSSVATSRATGLVGVMVRALPPIIRSLMHRLLRERRSGRPTPLA